MRKDSLQKNICILCIMGLSMFFLPACSDNYQKALKAYDDGDYKRAITFFSEAAEQGDARAQARLGECYYEGKGVLQDYTEAIHW